MNYSLPATRYPLLVVVGPTSSGKSELAVKLAKRFNGEIISCDSRQIYRGMNLGTGKIAGKWITSKKDGRLFLRYVYKSIPHHLIDFQNPAQQYSVARFQKAAQKTIKDILSRNKLPILCGGTMHWIEAVVYNQTLPNVKPNPKLRARLEKQSTDVLFKRLMKLDPARAKTIDKFNKRRLIRALEIIETTCKPVPSLSAFGEGRGEVMDKKYNVLWLGINIPKLDLYKKIDKRLKQRLNQGMMEEVACLHSPLFSKPACRQGREGVRGSLYPKSYILNHKSNKGLSWKKLESFGLEYKYISLYLQNKLPLLSPPQDLGRGKGRGRMYNEMLTQLSFAIKHYAKRQMTWWKKNKEIVWIKPDLKKAITLTKKFL